MRFTLRFICWLLMFGAISAGEVLEERIGPDSIERFVFVQKSDFRKSELVRVAREFLSQHSEPELAKLYVATTREAAGQPLIMGGHRDYISFMLQYYEPGWAAWGMAEAIRIGTNAVLRIRYPDGRLDRVALQGTDPLRRDGYEVLYVRFPPTLKEEVPGPPVPAVFFVTTEQQLSKELCENIAEDLQGSAGLARGDVRIRNDHWFVTSPEMPVRYEFWARTKPLEPIEFIERPDWFAGWKSDGSVKSPLVFYPTRPPKYCPVPLAGPAGEGARR